MNPRVIDIGVPVRDEIAQTDRTAHLLRQIAIDRPAFGENIKGGSRIVSGPPIGISHPMRSKVDTLLNRLKEIEARQVLYLLVGEKLLDRPGKHLLSVGDPG